VPRCSSTLAIAVLFALGHTIAPAQTRAPTARPSAAGSVPPLTVAVLKRDLARLRRLLDIGEDPNERDGQGFAPWMWAINFEENRALKLLLEKVSAIPPTDESGRRTLALTASLNNVLAGRQLLDKGVPVDSPAIDGASPLLVAAASGYTGLMKMLLDVGADPNCQDESGDTPLMAAVRVGSLDAANLLLHAHADPSRTDRRGRTALHWAARSGRVDMARLLTEAGATVDVPDDTGKTAMADARERGYVAVAEFLRNKGARGTGTVTVRSTLTPREAIERSLPLLVRGWQTWSERQSCGACHHRLMIARVAALARQRGFTAATVLANDQAQFFTRSALRSEPQLRKQLATEEGVVVSALGIHGDGSSGDALNLNAMLELGVPNSPSIEARALLLARKQLEDGSWRNGLPRVPILSSDFTTTAVAARTVAVFGGPADGSEIRLRVERARQWLIEHHPLTTDDKASRLLGLRWTHASESAIRSAADLLKREQHVDGGWSQLTGINSDAYATGMVLIALHWGIGLPASDSIYKRGVEYLLRTQETDGSWFVHKRAAASNPYFESGFPHGKFQFISYAGSCWATMALMYAVAPQDAADH